MSWSDEELRSLYQERTARDATRRGCPEPPLLARVAAGDAGADERAAVARHVADCSDCAVELQSVRRSLDSSQGGGAARGQRRWLGGTTGWLAAAALLALMLVPVLLWRAGGPDVDVTRGGGDLDVLPAPDATLSTPPEELAWPVQPGATGYRVRLLDARGEPVWESGPTEEARVALPAEVGRALGLEGAAFVWSVEVEGNAPRSRLGPYWFRVNGSSNR